MKFSGQRYLSVSKFFQSFANVITSEVQVSLVLNAEVL